MPSSIFLYPPSPLLPFSLPFSWSLFPHPHDDTWEDKTDWHRWVVIRSVHSDWLTFCFSILPLCDDHCSHWDLRMQSHSPNLPQASTSSTGDSQCGTSLFLELYKKENSPGKVTFTPLGLGLEKRVWCFLSFLSFFLIWISKVFRSKRRRWEKWWRMWEMEDF